MKFFEFTWKQTVENKQRNSESMMLVETEVFEQFVITSYLIPIDFVRKVSQFLDGPGNLRPAAESSCHFDSLLLIK